MDFREVFPVLEDVDGSGFGITRAYEGLAADAVSGAIPALMAKDYAGNLTFLQLDSQGRLPVSSEGVGTAIQARGEIPMGNETSGMMTVSGAEIALTSGKTYTRLRMAVSCTRETHAQLIWIDDSNEEILRDVILGPGQYTIETFPEGEVTAGSGMQALEVRARNLGRGSAIRAMLGAVEI